MVKKIFLLFSLLVCTCGEIHAQDMNTTDTSFMLGPRPSWFFEYCGTTNYDRVACMHRVIGIHKIKAWNDEYFKRNGETTTTMFSFELRKGEHARNQLEEIGKIVSGRVTQYAPSFYFERDEFGSVRIKTYYDLLSPGSIVTRANTGAFAYIGRTYNFSAIKSVVVTGTGNGDSIVKTQRPEGLTSSILNLPFPIAAGGMALGSWLVNCTLNPNNCGFYRFGKVTPSSDIGSNVCG